MIGLLLVNLGTPDEPETRAVRRYLREFFSDARVLDMNPVGRWMLRNLILLPFRPRQSAEAYRKIWTERGSPLLYHSRDLVHAVGQKLGPTWQVELAMRYGQPGIPAALEQLRKAGIDRVVVFPLYPQYASATTGSVVEAVFAAAVRLWNVPHIAVVEPFYDDPAFVAAFAAVSREVLDRLEPDHVLFSFHGLPERHVQKSDDTGEHCLTRDACCDQITEANRNCYRAQCFATARLIAGELGLAADRHTVCFQSRVGRVPWIRPYTDEVIDERARAGDKRLAVLCPAFVADCLETVEEIGIRGKEQFVAAGGEELALVPSLNSHPAWADAVVALIRRQAERISPPAA